MPSSGRRVGKLGFTDGAVLACGEGLYEDYMSATPDLGKLRRVVIAVDRRVLRASRSRMLWRYGLGVRTLNPCRGAGSDGVSGPCQGAEGRLSSQRAMKVIGSVGADGVPGTRWVLHVSAPALLGCLLRHS